MQGNPALNRVRWAHSGKEIAVGDSDGQVLVYDVGEVSKHESAFQFLTVPLKKKKNYLDFAKMSQPLTSYNV